MGYYIWELVTPYNLRRELQENKNLAVAVVVAAFILGMAIVIAASLLLVKWPSSGAAAEPSGLCGRPLRLPDEHEITWIFASLRAGGA